MTASILNFERDVMSMDAYQALDYLAYLRRTVVQRDTERSQLDAARYSEEQLRVLADVGRRDHEILSTLDALEASIHEQLRNSPA